MSQFNKYLEIIQEEKYQYDEGKFGNFVKGVKDKVSNVFNKKSNESKSNESQPSELLTPDNISKYNKLADDFISRCKKDNVKKYVTIDNVNDMKSISEIAEYPTKSTLNGHFLYDFKLKRLDKNTKCYSGDIDLLLAVFQKQPLKKIYEMYVSKGGQKSTGLSNLINDLRNHDDFKFSFGNHQI